MFFGIFDQNIHECKHKAQQHEDLDPGELRSEKEQEDENYSAGDDWGQVYYFLDGESHFILLADC